MRLVYFIYPVNLVVLVFRRVCAARNAARGVDGVVSGLAVFRERFMPTGAVRKSYNDKHGNPKFCAVMRGEWRHWMWGYGKLNMVYL